MLEDYSGFRWLKIEDFNVFGVMCAGVKKTKKVKQDYSRMDIVINNKVNGNLQNMTVVEFKNKIKHIFQYLYDEYGIMVDLHSLKFSKMEVNCTFELKEEFYKYHRVLLLLMFNLPTNFKKIGRFAGKKKKECRIEEETFYSGNSLIEAKIYDKKKQLEQTIQFESDANIMRIELILKKPQKINAVFGSTFVSDLTDDKLNKFYYLEFIRLFEKPYRKWQKDNSKILKNLINKHKDKSKNNWKSNLLRECSNSEQIKQIPLLLDVNDLLAQVKILDNNGHFARVRASILKQCNCNDVYLQNDSDKVEEILSKVKEAYDNYMVEIDYISELCSPTSGEVA